MITTVTPTINVLDLSEFHGFLYFLDRKNQSLSFGRNVHPLLDLLILLSTAPLCRLTVVYIDFLSMCSPDCS